MKNYRNKNKINLILEHCFDAFNNIFEIPWTAIKKKK